MLDLVRRRLDQLVEEYGPRGGSLLAVSEATGVPYDTLCKIKSGATPNPGVKHVQALYDYLHPPIY